MRTFRRRITAEEMKETIDRAVAEAKRDAQFEAHQAKCEADKAEIKKTLAAQDTAQRAMHTENSERFEVLESRLNAFSWRVIGWVIGGQAVLLTAAGTVIWALIGHKLGVS